MNILVAPSLLAANWASLESEVKSVEEAGADMLHLDVMDGSFVPPISFGQDFVRTVKKFSKVPLDVHLMINNPEAHALSFIEAGADILTFHVEATNHPHRLIQFIKENKCKAGIALNPGTSISLIDECIQYADLILVMTVNPGWGGQKFIPEMLDKIKAVSEHSKRRKDTFIQVDGGINNTTSKECLKAGANLLVAGTAIFSSSDYNSAVKSLRINN